MWLIIPALFPKKNCPKWKKKNKTKTKTKNNNESQINYFLEYG